MALRSSSSGASQATIVSCTAHNQTEREGHTRTDPAVHHLSADASVLQCAPTDPTEQSWWRVVLDSVLFTVALLQGYEALHAAAVATPDG